MPDGKLLQFGPTRAFGGSGGKVKSSRAKRDT